MQAQRIGAGSWSTTKQPFTNSGTEDLESLFSTERKETGIWSGIKQFFIWQLHNNSLYQRH